MPPFGAEVNPPTEQGWGDIGDRKAHRMRLTGDAMAMDVWYDTILQELIETNAKVTDRQIDESGFPERDQHIREWRARAWERFMLAAEERPGAPSARTLARRGAVGSDLDM
jgi:hypothetical protein